VTDEMVEETGRLLEDRQAGRAWGSFQKNEVGWGGIRLMRPAVPCHHGRYPPQGEGASGHARGTQRYD
jgi:hypothetical protein